MKIYKYVGPKGLMGLVKAEHRGQAIQSPTDVIAWARRTAQDLTDEIVATFVIMVDNTLRIADRHSEHVVCASGEPVLSAGEMAFDIRGETATVIWATNQSTGYCPEPTSWPAVEAALDAAAIDHPGAFSDAFSFRYCTACKSINVIKESWYYCSVCNAPLPHEWNLMQ